MHKSTPKILVIGAGPAGLMAAETIADGGFAVTVFDAMPSAGRKFLLAGKGGMNLTHSEPSEAFLQRYRHRQSALAPLLNDFGADQLRAWASALGIATFIGSSGRVFPVDMKAAPLLRAWLHRLRLNGVTFQMRHRWLGWHDGQWLFTSPEGEHLVHADAVVLALGGGSWARLGSDGTWLPRLQERQVEVAALTPSNCGFEVNWSAHFRERFAGHPITSVKAGVPHDPHYGAMRQGQFVITESGVEGSLIYALSASLRDEIAQTGQALLQLDLLPDRSLERVMQALSSPRGSRSLSSHLQSKLGLDKLKINLLRECVSQADLHNPMVLSHAIKALSIPLTRCRPIDESISSAGGVRFAAMNEDFMLHQIPGVFCAGEMLDWEAPTGGYLLTGCFSSGKRAGRGVVRYIHSMIS